LVHRIFLINAWNAIVLCFSPVPRFKIALNSLQNFGTKKSRKLIDSKYRNRRYAYLTEAREYA
jgi:hypothetical protein